MRDSDKYLLGIVLAVLLLMGLALALVPSFADAASPNYPVSAITVPVGQASSVMSDALAQADNVCAVVPAATSGGVTTHVTIFTGPCF